MPNPDEVMTRIGGGISLSQRGERAADRQVFAHVWEDIGDERGDPLHRCVLAHSMADVQDDVQEELVWDLRALQAADLLTEEREAGAEVTARAAGFYPSLHLNLADCYRRLGEPKRARDHLRRGQTAADALADDGYGRMIKGGLARLAERLRPA